MFERSLEKEAWNKCTKMNPSQSPSRWSKLGTWTLTGSGKKPARPSLLKPLLLKQHQESMGQQVANLKQHQEGVGQQQMVNDFNSKYPNCQIRSHSKEPEEEDSLQMRYEVDSRSGSGIVLKLVIPRAKDIKPEEKEKPKVKHTNFRYDG